MSVFCPGKAGEPFKLLAFFPPVKFTETTFDLAIDIGTAQKGWEDVPMACPNNQGRPD